MNFFHVTAAVILQKGKYLTARRKGSGSAMGKWEFPGGKIHSEIRWDSAEEMESMDFLEADRAVISKL